MKIWRLSTVTTLFILINLAGCSLSQPRLFERNVDADLVFLTPENHSQVRSPVNIQVRLNDMQLLKHNDKESLKTHIHVLINSAIPPLDRKMPHEEESVIEIESGKSSVMLNLPPGTHKLQLIAADEWHRPHIPPLISEIRTIKVTE